MNTLLDEAHAALQAGRHEAALAALDGLLEIDPYAPVDSVRFTAVWKSLYDAVNRCDWKHYDYLQRMLKAALCGTESGYFLGESALAAPALDNALLLASARKFCSANYAHLPQLPALPAAPQGAPRREGRLRIGFVGGDFTQQATAYLLIGVIEQWDRGAFELLAYDFGNDDGSELRRRCLRAYDKFTAIQHMTSLEAAELIRRDGVDVLVHLRGIVNGRLDIFAHRPCAIQVQYLYYPGTSGAPFMDWLVADAHVIPPGLEHGYSERILRLEGSYQPNDGARPLPPPLSRAELGMPPDAQVLANLGQSYKLTPDMFELWCALLRADARRILCLLDGGDTVRANLRREAAVRGVDPGRLTFLPPAATAVHLARLQCADVVLDTFPYNGHTLTSDSLWAGTPVVTLSGSTFASRVAGSLLHAVALPELIAQTPGQYVDIVEALLGDQARLGRTRQALVEGRRDFALFDPRAYAARFGAALAALATGAAT